jgi:hypothetical protein
VSVFTLGPRNLATIAYENIEVLRYCGVLVYSFAPVRKQNHGTYSLSVSSFGRTFDQSVSEARYRAGGGRNE